MRLPRIPRLRVWVLLAFIAWVALLLAILRPSSGIDATDARRIAMNQLAVELGKAHPEPPKPSRINVMAPGSGKYWRGAGAKPPEADRHWCVEIDFAVGQKTTGKGYYTITSEGTVLETRLLTSMSP